MDAKHFARAAVDTDDWRDPFDFDRLRTHVVAAIEAAVQAERTRCARAAWTIYHANTPPSSEYARGQQEAARQLVRWIEQGE